MIKAARRSRCAFPLAAALALAGCVERAEEGPAAAGRDVDRTASWFEPVAEEESPDFVHVRGEAGLFWFPEIMSGGGGWFDYDGDGDLDLYLVQGGDLGSPRGGLSNRLYRNDGSGRFVDVTRAAGVGDTSYGMGLVVGDFDGDGDLDLYVTNLGRNVMLGNRGDGTFRRIETGVDDSAWSTSGAALDYDRDGDLDLFVVNYVSWSPEIEMECYGPGGVRDYCHPSRYQAPAADLLLRNEGGLRFTDVSEEMGLLRVFGNGLGIAVSDWDGDLRPDVYVANDGMPNQLWVESGDGLFEDHAVGSGCAVNGLGVAEAGMGVALGDADGDGALDLFVTHLARETNTLYLNRSGFCEDATAYAGLGAPSLRHTGFGTGFADFDHDGRPDLWVSNGRVGREDLATDGDPFAEPDQVYRATGGGRFELLPPERSGVGERADNSRGAAFGDYDNDGDIDVLVVNNNGPERLYRNRGSAGTWVELDLTSGFEPAAIGARVGVRTADSVQWRLVGRSASYCSSNDPRAHFGLGRAARLDEVSVFWPDGRRQSFRDLPAAKIYRLGL